MVALTLLAVVAGLLASGTRLSIDVSSRGEARAESRRTERIELNLLRAQLAGALPYHYWSRVEGRKTEFIAFEGASDHIRFVSRDGILDGPGSLPRWVQIRQEVKENGQSKFVLEEHRILSPDNLADSSPSAQTEISRCTDIRFEYLDTADQKPQWRTSWTPSAMASPLPGAVRIECKMAQSSLKVLVPLDYSESAAQGMWFQ